MVPIYTDPILSSITSLKPRASLTGRSIKRLQRWCGQQNRHYLITNSLILCKLLILLTPLLSGSAPRNAIQSGRLSKKKVAVNNDDNNLDGLLLCRALYSILSFRSLDLFTCCDSQTEGYLDIGRSESTLACLQHYFALREPRDHNARRQQRRLVPGTI